MQSNSSVVQPWHLWLPARQNYRGVHCNNSGPDRVLFRSGGGGQPREVCAPAAEMEVREKGFGAR